STAASSPPRHLRRRSSGTGPAHPRTHPSRRQLNFSRQNGPVPLIRITDPTDDRLLDYTGLTALALRRRLETERGLYMAESTNVITRAIRAGHRPRSLLMAEKWLGTMAPVITGACGADDGGADVPVFVAEEP